MNYELLDGAICPIKNVNQATGTVLRCPGCGCIDLNRIESVIRDMDGCALQCRDSRCKTTYQIILPEEGTEVAES